MSKTETPPETAETAPAPLPITALEATTNPLEDADFRAMVGGIMSTPWKDIRPVIEAEKQQRRGSKRGNASASPGTLY